MNATERRIGLASALTLKNQEWKIRVISNIDPKTSVMADVLQEMTNVGTVLVFVTASESKKISGLSNIHGTHVDVVTHMSPSEVLKYDFCVFSESALKDISTHFVN